MSETELVKRLGGERCTGAAKPASMGVCAIEVSVRGRRQSMQFVTAGDPRVVRSVLLVAAPKAVRGETRRAPGSTGPAKRNAPVVVNMSIAGVRLGMSPAEVAAVLGAPVQTRASTPGPGQSAGVAAGLVERLYAGPVAVLFENGKAGSVVTRAAGHRTSGSSVGVGSSERDVRRIAGIRCATSSGSKTVLSCEVPVAGGPSADRTTFLLKDGVVGAVGLY